MSHPGLFVGGAVAALGWLVVQIYVSVPVMLVSVPRSTQPVFALTLASVGSVIVLPPVLAGLYATVREVRAEGDLRAHEVVTLYVLGCVRHARELFVATVVFRLVALVPAAVVFVTLLAGDTAVGYWQYATGGAGQAAGAPGPGDAIWDLFVVWLYAMVAGAVGRLLLAFYDLPVLFAGVSARRGWRAALRFARRRPRALMRYGAGRFLLWLPMLPVLLLQAHLVSGGVSPSDAGIGLSLYLLAAFVLGTISTTLLASYHVVVYERAVEPVLLEPATTGKRVAVDSPAVASPPAVESTGGSADGGPPNEGLVSGPPNEGILDGLTCRRLFAVSFAFLLVLSMAVGTAAIRVNDVRPMPGADPQPVDDSIAAEEVVGNAGHLLAHGDVRVQSAHYSVNDTTGERQLVMETEAAVDRSNRQARVEGAIREEPDADEWYRTELYGSTSAFALAYPGAGDPPEEVPVESRLFRETAGEWTVVYVPGYGLAEDGAVDTVPDADAGDWRIVERTGDEVVVGYTERVDDPDEDGRTPEVERVQLTVDAETGRPTHLVRNQTVVERENGTVVERSHGVEETTYGGYEDPEVERPDPVGSRGPIEWLWDLVYY